MLDVTSDSLRTMLRTEHDYQIPYGSREFDGGNSVLEQHSNWRCRICEWCYSVVDHYGVSREIVSFAMNYFDRLISKIALESSLTNKKICSREYQLVATACLFVATKVHSSIVLCSKTGCKKAAIHLDSFVTLSRDQFTAEDLINAERSLLDKLDWMVNPVTPLSFVSYMLCLLNRICEDKLQHRDLILNILHESSGYLSELALCIPDIVTELQTTDSSGAQNFSRKSYLSSHVAFTSILISMNMFTLEALPLNFRHAFIDRISQLSKEAVSVTSHSLLHPDNHEIRHLKSMLHKDFDPEIILDQTALGQNHPVCVAQRYGLIKRTGTDCTKAELVTSFSPQNVCEN